MITLRPAGERGRADYGWLQANYSFSFANYYDPRHMGFRALRVINEDFVAAGKGFPAHEHSDMEILTYVLEGAIEHRDSLGSGEVLRPGEVQYMSAGTGIEHSEFNPSRTEKLHSLQIWLLPAGGGYKPAYAQKAFPIQTEKNRLHLVASMDGREGSIGIRTDAELYAAALEPGARVEHGLRLGGHAWVQATRGEVTLNGTAMRAGDGAAVSGETKLTLESTEGAEFLLFDLR